MRGTRALHNIMRTCIMYYTDGEQRNNATHSQRRAHRKGAAVLHCSEKYAGSLQVCRQLCTSRAVPTNDIRAVDARQQKMMRTTSSTIADSVCRRGRSVRARNVNGRCLPALLATARIRPVMAVAQMTWAAGSWRSLTGAARIVAITVSRKPPVCDDSNLVGGTPHALQYAARNRPDRGVTRYRTHDPATVLHIPARQGAKLPTSKGRKAATHRRSILAGSIGASVHRAHSAASGIHHSTSPAHPANHCKPAANQLQ